MKRHSALYDWLASELKRVTSSQVAEDYSKSLLDKRLDRFVELTEQLRTRGADLYAAEAARVAITDWKTTQRLAFELRDEFPDFTVGANSRLSTMLQLAEYAAGLGESLELDDIDASQFELRTLDLKLPFAFLAHLNSAEYAESMVVFRTTDYATFERELQSSECPARLALTLMASVAASTDDRAGAFAMIRKSTPMLPDAAVSSFVQIVAVALGKPIHRPPVASVATTTHEIDALRVGSLFQQWDDVILALSEYRARTDILTKFLAAYHVFENLTVKYPLAVLQKKYGGRLFSLRHFRQLHKSVDRSEQSSLNTLLTNHAKHPMWSGLTFKAVVWKRWTALRGLLTEKELELALARLEVRPHGYDLKPGSIKEGQIVEVFGHTLYAIRCAVVHHKETELHLSDSNLEREYREIIEQWILPCMEELAFRLLGDPLSEVWYSKKELLLFES